MHVTVKRISFPSAAPLAYARGLAAWEGMERTGTALLTLGHLNEGDYDN